VTLPGVTENPASSRSWLRFCLFLGLVFILRGQAVLNIYPGMEGFDEFQHTAYLIHLAETQTLPILGQTMVPKSLYPEIAANPHSDLSWRQARDVGGLRYKDFYDGPSQPVMDRDILLFQAQHPPVYYKLTYRLFDAVRKNVGYREAVYTLRSIQLLLGAAALVFLILPVRKLIPHEGVARLAALAISLMPMYLMYILRVSNDALAVLSAAIVFYLLANIRDDRNLVAKAFAIGVLIAVGAMTKTIAFLFLPVVIGYLIILLFYKNFSRAKVITGLIVVPLLYIAICHRYHLDNKARHGTMFPALETIVNAEKSHDVSDLLGTIEVSDTWNFFIMRLIKENLWKSGMTFLEPWSGFEWIAFSVIVMGAMCWLLVLFQPCRRAFMRDPVIVRLLLLCVLAVGATFAGAYAHGLNCRLAWGALITPAYYVMVAFPALLSLVFFGLTRIVSTNFMTVLLVLLCATYFATELDSLIRIAIPYWTNSTQPAEVFARLRIVSSSWTDPLAATGWLVFASIGLICAILNIQRTYRAVR
jgi:Dolichyl-phosphate-mannose-protein mannosyltransferase